MVHLMRFLIVMASVISSLLLSPREAQRMSRRTLTGEVKDMRKVNSLQQGKNR